MDAMMVTDPPARAAHAPRVSASGLRRLVGFAAVFALCLLMLGAWVRLTQAGLGCPDWPGCYGHISPAHAKNSIAQAVARQGGEHGPVSMAKAWHEMIHRYAASTLGLLIVAIAALAWRSRAALAGSHGLALALVGVVVLQGLFGMWTVTLLLQPLIVTGHLIGGVLTFSLLVWLWLRLGPKPRYVDAEPVAALRVPALAALFAVAVQIALGGWVSTNFAALACPDFPTCRGAWLPPVDFATAFHPLRAVGPDGVQAISLAALTAIHVAHRTGAAVVALVAGFLGWRAARTPGVRGWGAALLVALVAQVTLGISNVVFGLPLPVAVAHNGVASVLLATVIALNFRAFRARYQI